MAEKQASSRLFDLVEFHLDMAFWSILGDMARTGLNRLTKFEYGGPLYANIAGCVVMGAHQRILKDKVLAARVSTAFCGTLTSFASLIITLFNYSTTPEPVWGNKGYSVMVFLAYLIIEMSCSIASFRFGQHLGLLMEHYKIEYKLNERLIARLGALAGLASWIAMIVIAAAVNSQRQWPISGAVAPIAMYGRFYLAKLNTPTNKPGTFIANMVGTLTACVFTILAAPSLGFTEVQTQVLQGLVDGFCGGLSTISTFVVELCTLPLPKAYKYGVTSIALAFCFAVLIMGSFYWTGH